jgi:hypothetical protein
MHAYTRRGSQISRGFSLRIPHTPYSLFPTQLFPKKPTIISSSCLLFAAFVWLMHYNSKPSETSLKRIILAPTNAPLRPRDDSMRSEPYHQPPEAIRTIPTQGLPRLRSLAKRASFSPVPFESTNTILSTPTTSDETKPAKAKYHRTSWRVTASDTLRRPMKKRSLSAKLRGPS